MSEEKETIAVAMLRSIPFTQFIAPNGVKKRVFIHRPDEVVNKAEQIMLAGFIFTAEILSNGIVSLAIEGKNCDVAIRLNPNDETIPDAVDKLILEFDIEAGLKKDQASG